MKSEEQLLEMRDRLKTLEVKNETLISMLLDVTDMLDETMAALPDEFKALDDVKRARAICRRIKYEVCK
jgi:hypothetical protein